MRSGSWDGATTTDNVRVTVAGTVRPVKSVRIQSGMRDGHPRSDASSWCVESTIEWADPNLVTSTSPHPFGGVPASDQFGGPTEWLPKAGDEVVIETGDGELGQWWVQHRGVIDDTTGSIADGTARSTTVDMIEDLEGDVTFGALLSTMPPRSDGAGKRHIGLQSIWMVDRMLRRPEQDFTGWYATPPATWQTVGLCTGMGSMWPEVGELQSGHANGNPDVGPSIGADPNYGVALSNISATYLLNSNVSRSSIVVTASVPVQGVADGEPWRMNVLNVAGEGVFIRYEHDTDRIYYGALGGVQGWVTATSGGVRATRVAIHATTSTITYRLDDGRTGSINLANGSPWPQGAVNRVTIDSPGRAGWWMVEGVKTGAQRWDTLNAPQTARIRSSSTAGGTSPWWRASRDIIQEDTAQWLQEQVDAECAAMWLDEDGVMQWAGRGVLDAQPVVRAITSVRDVDDIQWESRRRRLARSVWIPYLRARPEMGYYGDATRQLWQSDSIDVGAGETEVSTIQVPEDQDWIAVDLVPHHITQHGRSWDHYTVGSTYGGTQYRASNQEERAWALYVDCSMSQINLRTYEVTFGAWSTMSPVFRVKTEYPPNPNAFMRSGAGLLKLQGRARTFWYDEEVSATAGSVGPARYTHDVGWRVQDVNDGINDLLQYIRSAATSSRPYVTGLTINHDPRLQVGDKIRVQDVAVTGADFDLIIQERDIDTEAMTETISGRVTATRIEWRYGPSSTDESRLEPAGPTPITPSAEWAREEAV